MTCRFKGPWLSGANDKMRSKLLESLCSMLQTADIDEISISELTRNAGVSRSFFYAHYENKEQVIREHTTLIMQECKETMRSHECRSIAAQSLCFVETCERHRAFFNLLEKRNLVHCVIDCMLHYREEFLRGIPKNPRAEGESQYEDDLILLGITYAIIMPTFAYLSSEPSDMKRSELVSAMVKLRRCVKTPTFFAK